MILLTIKEAAELLKVKERLIYRKVATGQLPVYRIGRAIRIDQQDLIVFKSKSGGDNGSPQ